MVQLTALQIGNRAELHAELHLLPHYPAETQVVARNWRFGNRCELDRILWIPSRGLLVIVEIRYRAKWSRGRFSALDSLSFSKQRSLKRAIYSFLRTLSAHERREWGLAGLRVDLWFGSEQGWEVLSGLELRNNS